MSEKANTAATNQKQERYSHPPSTTPKEVIPIGGKIKDITGRQFGRLTALYPEYKNGNYTRRWICQCKCGTILPVRQGNLANGHTKSCGCLFQERGTAWVLELPESDAIIYVCKNDPYHLFVDDIESAHLFDEFSWTTLDNGLRVQPVTQLANGKNITIGQLKLGIFHGELQVDHINHKSNDLRLCNIRAVTKWENLCNRLRGIGKIKCEKDGSYTVTAYTSQGHSKKFFGFATQEEAESFKMQWDDEHFGECTYERSQRIAKEHALHYNSWPTFLDGKRAETVEEMKKLPETNLFKFLLRRYHGWMLDLADGRTIKSGGYEICGIVVNGREMPLDEATCYDKMLEIITEFEKFKTTDEYKKPKDPAA